MKATDLFVQALENEGVELIVGVPGEENVDLLNSLKSSSINFIVTRHEQSAGFIAATYGRLTGKAGVVLSTLGPGATNLFTAAAFAQLGGMPMVMITGQKPIKDNEQIRFQIIDVVSMMRPVTKFTERVSFASAIPSTIREAFKKATSERPGAVHIELPENVGREDTEKKPFKPRTDYCPVARPEAIKKAAADIQTASRPLILIGASAKRPGVREALTELIEKHKLFFFTTQLGKGLVDEHSSFYLGTAALSKDDFIHSAIKEADLILSIGHDVVEKPPFLMKNGDQHVIHVNYTAADVDEAYHPDFSIIGDIADTLNQLSATLLSKDRGAGFAGSREEIKTALEKFDHDDRFPILPQRLIAVTRKVLGRDDIITLDNGMYKVWFTRAFPASQPDTMLLDNSLASMGAGLPAAIAAKMVHPKRRVISINGDGGFMMNSQELETAVRLKLDFVVLILRDDAYGMIRWKQEAMGFDNYGLDYGNPDFVRYAESYGAKGYRPESVAEFEQIFTKILDEKGVHLIDLQIDYSLNQDLGKKA